MTGVAALRRFHLRSIRSSTVIWAMVLGVVAFAVVAAYVAAYPGDADRAGIAALGENPAFRALLGVPRALDTPDGFAAWRFGGIAVVITGVWGLLLSTKLLRGDEDFGRAEIVLVGVVGRRQWPMSVVISLAVAVSVLTAAIGGGLVAGGVSIRSALLIAASVTSAGWVFGSVGVLTSQAAPTRRSAAGIAGGLLLGAFLVRAVADSASGMAWLRWATPLGWTENVHPTSTADVRPLLLAVGAGAVLSAVGTMAVSWRDIGGSLLPDRGARPARSFGLAGPFGFALRHRASAVASWMVGLSVTGVVFGAISKDVADFVETSDSFVDMFTRLGVSQQRITEGYLGLVLVMAMIGISGYVSTEVVSLRNDEAVGRTEMMLARAVSRARLIGSGLLAALVAATVLALVDSLAVWLGTVATSDGYPITGLLGAGLNLVPCAVFFLGLGSLVLGVAPRAVSGTLVGVLAGSVLITMVGGALDLPQWVLDISPFTHVAPAPAAPVNWGGVWILTGVGVVAAGAGVAAFARRDLVQA